MTEAAAPFPVMSIAQCNALMTAPGAKFEMEEKVINGIALRTYKHAPQTLRDVVLNSKQWDFREYLVYHDERVTYAAHYKAVAHLARALRETFGVRKGDRVAVVMRNYPQWAVGFWAALAIGAIATPLNSWWTGEELEYGLADSGAKVAIVDQEKLERIREHLPKLTQLKTIIVARGGEEEADPRVVSLEKLIGAALDIGSMRSAKWPLGAGTALRLVVMPAIAFGLCNAIGLTGMPLQVAMLCVAAPVATSSYILARQLGGDARLMANIVTLTTLLSLVTIPLTIWLTSTS
jgi:acyl-CoA synthetase (AMP-forming)/AMP-acid ligase II